MQINSELNYNNRFSLKKMVSPNNKKYNTTVEKRAYIESKTEPLEELCTLTFLGAIMSGIFNVKTIEKNSKNSEKLSIALVMASVVLLIMKWIKQIQLSKEYDKENNL